ncbi:DPP IV N-terminal domain-containing protein, partial [Gemmatimonas sp.]|uniref:DPP IV N-terminal domain-containing protein n=1 Tax=Gemmatimonas sp. TaxID=1962908 RepID=UPI00333F63EE
MTSFLSRRALPTCTLVALFVATPLSAHAQGSFDFTIPNIMRGPEHVGREPQNVSWSADGKWLYFQWAPAGAAWDAPLRPYRVQPVAGATPVEVSDAHMDSVAALLADGPLSRDRMRRAVATGGDLYLVNTKSGTARRLTQTVAFENDPRFSADEQHLLFVRDGNAYALELATGAVRQLTDIRSGPAPRDSARATGMRGALERQQRELFDVIRDQQRADSVRKAQRDAALARALPSVYLPMGERLAQLSVSPSLRSAVLLTA